jgi:hypothetical protein
LSVDRSRGFTLLFTLLNSANFRYPFPSPLSDFAKEESEMWPILDGFVLAEILQLFSFIGSVQLPKLAVVDDIIQWRADN